MKCSGITHCDTHELRGADAHDIAVSFSICVASGHRFERSVTVNKYRNSCDARRGLLYRLGCVKICAVVVVNHRVQSWYADVFFSVNTHRRGALTHRCYLPYSTIQTSTLSAGW